MKAKKSKSQRCTDAWVRWKSQPYVREFIGNDTRLDAYLRAAFIVGAHTGRRVEREAAQRKDH